MNFGHIVGEYHNLNEWGIIMHYISSLTPIIVACVVIGLAFLTIKKQQTATERIRKDR